MQTIHNYGSTVQALEELKNKGYNIDFNVEFDEMVKNADQYIIDFLYHYEGESNPSDESSVYGVRNRQTGVKGVLVAGNLSFLEGKKRQIILDLEMRSRESE